MALHGAQLLSMAKSMFTGTYSFQDAFADCLVPTECDTIEVTGFCFL